MNNSNQEKLICVARMLNRTNREVTRVTRSVASGLIIQGWHYIKKGNFKRLYKRA